MDRVLEVFDLFIAVVGHAPVRTGDLHIGHVVVESERILVADIVLFCFCYCELTGY
jgi:hypothetical protein